MNFDKLPKYLTKLIFLKKIEMVKCFNDALIIIHHYTMGGTIGTCCPQSTAMFLNDDNGQPPPYTRTLSPLEDRTRRLSIIRAQFNKTGLGKMFTLDEEHGDGLVVEMCIVRRAHDDMTSSEWALSHNDQLLQDECTHFGLVLRIDDGTRGLDGRPYECARKSYFISL